MGNCAMLEVDANACQNCTPEVHAAQPVLAIGDAGERLTERRSGEETIKNGRPDAV